MFKKHHHPEARLTSGPVRISGIPTAAYFMENPTAVYPDKTTILIRIAEDYETWCEFYSEERLASIDEKELLKHEQKQDAYFKHKLTLELPRAILQIEYV